MLEGASEFKRKDTKTEKTPDDTEEVPYVDKETKEVLDAAINEYANLLGEGNN